MLLWTKTGRRGVVAGFALIVLVLLVAPLAVVLVGALAKQWTSILPSSLTLGHLHDALSADNLASLVVSVQTAIISGAIAVAIGTWAAMSADRLPRSLRSVANATFMLPVAVPSVVIGFGLLVAYSQPPVVLNGTKWIVIAAQTTLVFSFAYNTVSAALSRMDGQLDDVASSLGARPWRVLLTIRLPLLLPAITAAAALSVALCMGELGATILVYPPTWRTLPVSIYGLSDRGNIYVASADTLVLLVVTALLLTVIGRAGVRASRRQRG